MLYVITLKHVNNKMNTNCKEEPRIHYDDFV